MLRKLKIPALFLGALMTVLGPAAAVAADRGGHGGGGRASGGGQSFSRGRSFSGGGRTYNYGRNEFRGGGGFYRGPSVGVYGYYGAPYAYAPAYPYYAPNTCAGYYDQWGRWQVNPYCSAGPYGY